MPEPRPSWTQHRIPLGLAGLLLIAHGCASPARHSSYHPDPTELARDLNTLAGQTAEQESWQVASTALRRSQALAILYHSVHPAWCHNFLVNVGCRQRGLCYEWAEDLMAALAALDPQHFSLHWGVARSQTFREHNAVVITARNKPFATGLVLDPWRQSGRLVWIAVSKDTYPWKQVPFQKIHPPEPVTDTSCKPN